jgi:hypothetical protein
MIADFGETGGKLYVDGRGIARVENTSLNGCEELVEFVYTGGFVVRLGAEGYNGVIMNLLVTGVSGRSGCVL